MDRLFGGKLTRWSRISLSAMQLSNEDIAEIEALLKGLKS